MEEWSVRHRDLYMTTHETPVKFKPTVSAGEQPQTHALGHSTTGTGIDNKWIHKLFKLHTSKHQNVLSDIWTYPRIVIGILCNTSQLRRRSEDKDAHFVISMTANV
jgi:hypothetical protein